MYKYIFTTILACIVIALLILYKPEYKRDKLVTYLDSFDLHNKWLPGYNVKCLSGEVLPDKSTTVKTSHCSCFVYAVCKNANIKMIGTPEYKQYNLSTNQIKWLESEKGKEAGWVEIKEDKIENKYRQAHKMANQGKLVIVGMKATSKTYGHIAIVRPSDKIDYFLVREGPQLITSSHINSYSVSLKEDFMLHNKEIKELENNLQFFVHEL